MTPCAGCERSEHSIDVALNVDSLDRIALEVDGPSHFLQNEQPNGPTCMRNRFLRARGWRVAVVDYREWNMRTQMATVADSVSAAADSVAGSAEAGLAAADSAVAG